MPQLAVDLNTRSLVIGLSTQKTILTGGLRTNFHPHVPLLTANAEYLAMKPSLKNHHNKHARFKYYPGSRQWRKDRGLMVLSDFSREYESVRCARGPYDVTLPGDYK